MPLHVVVIAGTPNDVPAGAAGSPYLEYDHSAGGSAVAGDKVFMYAMTASRSSSVIFA